MKNAVVLALIIMLIISCAGQKELTKSDSEKIFSHTVELDSSTIKTKVLTYINENFYSGEAVIQTNDQNILSGNYNFFCSNFDPLGSLEVYCKATFIVKYYHNKYKIKFLVKELFTKSSSGLGNLHPSLWGNYSAEIKNNFNAFDEALYNYMITQDTF